MRPWATCVGLSLLIAACKPAAPQAQPLPEPSQRYQAYLQRCEQLIVGADATRKQMFNQYREQSLSQWQQESDQTQLSRSCQQGLDKLQQIFKPQGCE